MRIEIISKTPESGSNKTPILFVHGAWHAAWCWDEHFLSYFYTRGYPAYALSLSNHGKTKGKKRLNFTLISDYIKDLAETVKTFDKKPIVIGHSMGGIGDSEISGKKFSPRCCAADFYSTPGYYQAYAKNMQRER